MCRIQIRRRSPGKIKNGAYSLTHVEKKTVSEDEFQKRRKLNIVFSCSVNSALKSIDIGIIILPVRPWPSWNWTNFIVNVKNKHANRHAVKSNTICNYSLPWQQPLKPTLTAQSKKHITDKNLSLMLTSAKIIFNARSCACVGDC